MPPDQEKKACWQVENVGRAAMVIFGIGAWPSATPPKLARKQREEMDWNIL